MAYEPTQYKMSVKPAQYQQDMYDFSRVYRPNQNAAFGGYGNYGISGGNNQYRPSAFPEWNRPAIPNANQQYNQGWQAQVQNQWGQPFEGFQNTYEWWKDPKQQAAMQSWLPYAQFGQNNYQYAKDFNEAQRRWNAENDWRRQQDQFGMGLSMRQQDMAEWQANEAARQWASQFGWQQTQDNRTWDLSNRQFGLEQELGRGNLGVSQQRADTEAQNVKNQFTLGQRELDVKDWYNRQQVGIAQQANQIDQMWKSGQLSNQQRELALAELTQKQNDTFRNAQLAQEATLQREQMQNQQQVAALQAYGRFQAPNTRWVRSWG